MHWENESSRVQLQSKRIENCVHGILTACWFLYIIWPMYRQNQLSDVQDLLLLYVQAIFSLPLAICLLVYANNVLFFVRLADGILVFTCWPLNEFFSNLKIAFERKLSFYVGLNMYTFCTVKYNRSLSLSLPCVLFFFTLFSWNGKYMQNENVKYVKWLHGRALDFGHIEIKQLAFSLCL